MSNSTKSVVHAKVHEKDYKATPRFYVIAMNRNPTEVVFDDYVTAIGSTDAGQSESVQLMRHIYDKRGVTGEGKQTNGGVGEEIPQARDDNPTASKNRPEAKVIEHIFIEAHATKDSKQLNGNVGPVASGGGCLYEKPTASFNSRQINGHVADANVALEFLR